MKIPVRFGQLIVVILLVLFLFNSFGLAAQITPAGTEVQNIATASFLGGGKPQFVTSNEVLAVVQEIIQPDGKIRDLAKQATPPDGSEVLVGDELEYVISFTSETPLTNLVITDTLSEFLAAPTLSVSPEADSLTYNETTRTIEATYANLPVQTTVELTISTSIVGENLEGQNVINDGVTVTWSGGSETSNPTQHTIRVIELIGFLSKLAMPVNKIPLAAGDRLRYTINFNSGGAPLTNVRITDTLSEFLIAPVLSISPRADALFYNQTSRTITAIYSTVPANTNVRLTIDTAVVEGVPINEIVVNEGATVTWSGGRNTSNATEHPIKLSPETISGLVKQTTPTEGTEVTVGEELKYNISFSSEEASLTNVVITDKLSEFLAVPTLSISPEADSLEYDETTHQVRVEYASVPAQTTVELTITARVIGEDIGGETVINEGATIIWSKGSETSNPTNHPIKLPYETISGLVKQAIPLDGTEITVGEELKYTISFSSELKPLTNVVITDTLSEFLVAPTLSISPEADSLVYNEATQQVTATYASLPAQTSVELTITARLTGEDIEGETVINEGATVIWSEGNETSNSTNHPIKLLPETIDGLAKQATPPNGTEVTVGDELKYTISFNSEEVPLTDVVITDTLSEFLAVPTLNIFPEADSLVYDEVTREIRATYASVPAQMTVELTITTQIVGENIDGEIVINEGATIEWSDGSETSNTTQHPIKELIPETIRGLVKQAVPRSGTSLFVGDSLKYIISFTSEEAPLTEVVITDTLSEFLAAPTLSISPGASSLVYDEATRQVRATYASLPPQTVVELTITARVIAGAGGETVINEGATVIWSEGNETSNFTEHTIQIEPEITPLATISDIVKQATPTNGTPLVVGDKLSYTISFSSEDEPLTNVRITDTLSKFLSTPVLSISPEADWLAYNETSRTIVAIYDSVPAQTNITLTIDASVVAETPVGAMVINEGALITWSEGSDTSNPTSHPIDPSIQPLPETISGLAKQATPPDRIQVTVGDELKYTISFNSEEVPLTNVVITDTLSEFLTAPTLSIFPEADSLVYNETTRTVRATYAKVPVQTTVELTITARVKEDIADTTGKTVINEGATVEWSEGSEISNPTEHPIKPPPETIEGLIKQATPLDGSELTTGDELTYTISFSSELTPLTNVVITDTLSEFLAAPTLSISPKADSLVYDETTRQIRAEYASIPAQTKVELTITTEVIGQNFDGKAAINEGATVTWSEGSETSNPTTHPLKYLADINIIKESDPELVTLGGPVSYRVTVTNNGPNAVEGLNVVDELPDVLEGATWSCLASEGSSCTPEGSGNINDTVNVLNGGVLTYNITATLSREAIVGENLENIAKVTLPEGVKDPNLEDNEDNEVDLISRVGIEGLAKIAEPSAGTALKPAEELSYNISFDIIDSLAVSNVRISDTISSFLDLDEVRIETFVDARLVTPDVLNYNEQTGELLIVFDLLPAGAQIEVIVTAVVKADVPAEALITNAGATVEWNDISSETSDPVVNPVALVCDLLILPDGSVPRPAAFPNDVIAAPSASVFLPYTLQNTGNGTNVYNLSTTIEEASDFSSNVSVYLDTNADGNPDGEAIDEVSVTAGEVVDLIVVAVLPEGSESFSGDVFINLIGQCPEEDGSIEITAQDNNNISRIFIPQGGIEELDKKLVTDCPASDATSDLCQPLGEDIKLFANADVTYQIRFKVGARALTNVTVSDLLDINLMSTQPPLRFDELLITDAEGNILNIEPSSNYTPFTTSELAADPGHSGTISWNFESLPVGSEVVISLRSVVKPEAQWIPDAEGKVTIDNNACIVFDGVEDDYCVSTDKQGLGQFIGLDITKTADPTQVAPGDDLSYAIDVRNPSQAEVGDSGVVTTP